MEDELLAELAANPDDEATRMVYRDWLEDHGDERAEYLRMQSELSRSIAGERQHEQTRRKLRKLQGKLLRSWREWLLSVSRSKIENCVVEDDGAELKFEFECPKQWASLHPADDADDPTIRFCDQCGKHVFFCETVAEARKMADWGQCVAVDETLVRKDHDVINELRGMFVGMPSAESLKMPKRLEKVRQRRKRQELQ